MRAKKIFNKLAEERSSELKDLEKKINSGNLIYKYKTEGIIPKDFSNDQNLIELFKDLRYGNINSKEVLKDQIKFKSDLAKTKKRKLKIKIERSNKFNTKC